MTYDLEFYEDKFEEFDIDNFKSDYERAKYLQQLLINRSTNDGPSDNKHYEILRRYFLSHHKEVKEKLPSFINDKRDLSHFWSYIKNKFGSYEERRVFIRNKFVAVLDYLEKSEISPPFIEDMKEELEYFNSSVIMNTWRKLLKRKEKDPEGALTLSNSLVESSLKHILDELKTDYSRKASLHQLYKKVAKELKLAPEMYEEEVFKQILGSCSGVIDGLNSLRSELGDAHGDGKKSYKPTDRHSELAINISSAFCLFLLRTLKKQQKRNDL